MERKTTPQEYDTDKKSTLQNEKKDKKTGKQVRHLPIISGGFSGITNIILLLSIFLFAVALFYCIYGASRIGRCAGNAIGSWKGMTEGTVSGLKEGKTEGLRAKDTIVLIGNEMKRTGRLQVLLVDLNLSDIYQQGSGYAALYSIEGEGTFTVDLSQSQVLYDEEHDQITIEIPRPDVDFYVDDLTWKIRAEYQPRFFDGRSDDGYEGFLNSREQILQRGKEQLSGDHAMVQQAEAAALSQVEFLAGAVCGSDASIKVQFAGS